jgi:adenine deaminase
MTKSTLKKLISTAAGNTPADLLVRGGKIADVYSGRFIEGDLVVTDGLVAAIGKPGLYQGLEIIDAAGQYVLPAFIDSHIHIESSFLSPPELGRLLVPRGTSTIIADPHEIANVAGLAGLDYMLQVSEDIVLDIKFMLPSCVPCTSYEHNGAILDAAVLEAPLKHERILGLGELMDYQGVINENDDILEKILLALNQGKLIDGHSPGLSGRDLSAYMAGMVHTDHECSTVEEMNQRIEMGMYVMLRQGSACHDLQKLLQGVTSQNSRRCLFCSDDCQPKTILEKGHIDNSLRLCVEYGLDPMIALRMATLNAAECFGLKDRGGFAPGLRADIVLLNNLEEFKVSKTFIKGKLAALDGSFLFPHIPPHSGDSILRSSFHVKDFSARKLVLPLNSDHVWVIDVRPGTVVTGKKRATVKRDSSGAFVFNPSVDIAKIAVVERHRNTGNVGLGLIRGYGIRCGAAAISVAHDSHNIIVVGANDNDMVLAVETLISLGGGAVLVRNGTILERMPLPLGGLMSDQTGEWVDLKLRSLQQKAVEELGINKDVEPLMTLCFMSLPVIPELKITDMGLFDTLAFKFIPLEAADE